MQHVTQLLLRPARMTTSFVLPYLGETAMAAESSQTDRVAWTLYRNAAGLWHWKRGEHGNPSTGYDRLSDCLADAQVNGYEPALHLLRLEPAA
jgi:hypothetical protein